MEKLPRGAGFGTCSSFPAHQPAFRAHLWVTQRAYVDFPLLNYLLIEVFNCSRKKTQNSFDWSQGIELPPKPGPCCSAVLQVEEPASLLRVLPQLLLPDISSEITFGFTFCLEKLIKNRVYHPYKLISSSKHYSWAFSSLHTAPKIVSEDAELLAPPAP